LNQYYKIFDVTGYAYNISVYLGKNQHTTDDETTVTQATVRCHVPLVLIHHQIAPKSWVCEDAGSPKCRHLSTQLHIASHNAVIFIINFTPQFQNL